MTETDAAALAEQLEAARLQPRGPLPPLPKARTKPRATPGPVGSSPMLPRPKVLAPSVLVMPSELTEPEVTVPQERYELDELVSDKAADVPTIANGSRQRTSHVARVWFEQAPQIESGEVACLEPEPPRTEDEPGGSKLLIGVGVVATIVGAAFFALALGDGASKSAPAAKAQAAPVANKAPLAAPEPAKALALPVVAKTPLTITSTPVGATVTLIVSGQPTVIGTTPVTRALAASRDFEVVVSHPGHRSEIVRMKGDQRPAELNVRLHALKR